jgi:hypothetical protein
VEGCAEIMGDARSRRAPGEVRPAATLHDRRELEWYVERLREQLSRSRSPARLVAQVHPGEEGQIDHDEASCSAYRRLP